MDQPHVISLDDFKGYSVVEQIAGSSKKKLTMSFCPMTSEHLYRVVNGVKITDTTDFEEAIRLYNE